MQIPSVESSFPSGLTRAHGKGADPAVELRDEDPDPASRLEDLSRDRTDRRYVLKGEVARGGMGAVLKVFDTDLRRSLAMKVILDTRSSLTPETNAVDPAVLSRFLEEAQITGQLDHPGVVPVHELGVDSDGRVYFTMQLVRGRTLRQVFGLVNDGEDGWNQTRALGVLLNVCETMSYAHDKGVIHRDLKPANVMVGKYGEVYVMDWGLARVDGRGDSRDVRLDPEAQASLSEVRTDRGEGRDSQSDSPLVTMDGAVVGTPAFMPPEQAQGRVADLDRRSDVYSVGAMLYQLLTGGVPFVPPGARISPRTLLLRVLEGPPKPIRELAPRPVPIELEAICEKAMARDPKYRYPAMAALATDLRAYLEGRVVEAHRTGAVAEIYKWVQRNKPLAAALVAAVLALVAGLATSLAFKARSDESAAVALEREREAHRERNNVLRLSAFQDLTDLQGEAAALWPAVPHRIPEFESWLVRAQDLTAGLNPDPADDDPGHRAQLASLRARAVGQADGEGIDALPRLEFADDEDRWWHAQLQKLVAEIESFGDEERGLIAGQSPEFGRGVERRLAFAQDLREGFAPGGEWAARWKRDLPAIRAVYPGLDLPVQVGLLPIGADPHSGLWEFLDQATGMEPRRGADGQLEMTAESGVVLVLLPGGAFWMGAQASDSNGLNYDAQALSNEAPVHEVTLSPFFLSKYEMTQAQWERMTGRNPSQYRDPTTTDAAPHPVEQITWLECAQWLPRMGLVLPSEAQWEYGARAGTDTPWWTGAERESLREADAVNLADQTAARGGATWPSVNDWPELDDGAVVHSEIGRYAPNAFGLHEVHGNLLEWCLDGSSDYPASPSSDPVFPGEGTPNRVSRGGCFYDTAGYARSALRLYSPPAYAGDDLGVRPARHIAD